VPGIQFSPTSPVSDNKVGSVLFYPIYTSSATAATTQNTRFSITNAHTRRAAYVHLFFVDGTSCSVADMYICLTANQTATFLASAFDPGTTGYLIAIATDSQGCPIAFNALMGDLYVKLANGHQASLAAEAAAGLNVPPCDATAFAAQLNFDGVDYNLLGRALALSNIPDRASGNSTMLILNRIGGNLAIGAATLGPVFGILYNDTENAFSFNFSPNACQLINTFSNSFPRTVPRIETVIPAGRSGWMRLWSFEDAAIFGAMLNANSDTATSASAFTNGHNLHKLTLTAAGVLTIPIFPPNC
jgi:hypothetical protein